MELDAATLGTLIGAVVLALGGREGVAQFRRRREPSTTGDSLGPGQSRVSKADVKELVAHAEAEASWRSEVRGKLDRMLERQSEHAAADERRFGEVEADNAELHRRWHALNDKVTPIAFALPVLEQRLDDTRRQAGIDTHPGVELPRRAR